MTLGSRAWRGAATAIACVAFASQAFAQAGTGGPQRSDGLFGRNTADPNASQKLDITVSSTGGYETNSRPDVAAVILTPQDSPGYSTTLESAAGYSLRGHGMQVRASGSSAQRYFQPVNGVVSSSFQGISHSGAVGFTAASQRTTLTINQAALFSSAPLYGLFAAPRAAVPGEAPPTAPSYTMNTFESHSYGSTAALAHQVTKYTSVSTNFDWHRTDTLGAAAGRQILNVYTSGVDVNHRIGRNTTTTVGYVYRLGEQDYNDPLRPPHNLPEHGVQLGLNHQWALSGTRHVTVGAVGGGSTMLVTQPADAGTFADKRYSRFFGQMGLAYEFGRTWQARADVRQGVDYLAGLGEPVLAKSGSTSISGLVARRVDVVASAAYSNGKSALALNAAMFDTYTGDARVRVALSRKVATYVEYMYYVYDSRGTLPLVPGLPSMVKRSSVRAGFVLWVPAL